MKEKDYEQLYYDSLYENKKLKKENEVLKEEILIIKSLNKNNELKILLAKLLAERIKKNKDETEKTNKKRQKRT